ncbi:MAG: ATP-dependent zinc metalloprotease FtsH [Flavobacteriales bacterium]|nr:ATP-dependent zinc metalloprotease FtsH [Flavobacteriales bacterium]MCC6939431.1 ATP-dependent zinc metalloprotease FtsH [Flavobacteriales bacterium]
MWPDRPKPSNVENKNDKNEPKRSERPKRSFNFYWIYGIIILVILSIQLFQYNGSTTPLNVADFWPMLDAGDVEKVEIVNDQVVKVTIKQDALGKEPHKSKVTSSPIAGPNLVGPHYVFNIGNSNKQKDKLVEELDKHGVHYSYTYPDNWGREILNWVLFFGAMILIWVFVMRRLGGGGGPGGQIFNIGKSRAQVFEGGKSTNVTFNDVAGLAEAKEELQEIVDFLKTPKKYTDLGAKIPKGALLVGPPGTGKTLLAKAIAGEANVPFFSLSGSDFVEMFVGVGASRVRDLFKQAKEKAPSIIFIDEIDAIGRARGRSVSMGANDERENTLNQLLTEMDGFGTNSGVILIGATNRADVLDRALMRAGRFDRQIFVDMPDLNEREQILRVHLKPLKMDINVDVDFLARQTPGFSGADLANICNEAALIAARKQKHQVDKQDFLDAVDRVIGGLEKKNKIITADEKKAIAYHEAGHATVSWLVEHASPLVKVTIVPRGRSLGAAWYLPEERHLTTTEQMLDEICAALGGRAAEDVMYGKISTGALSDLEKVTKQAYAMVSMYGLNDKVGNVSYYDSSGQSEYTFGKPYSERTAQTIDEEVSKLIETQYQRAKRILTENKDKLTALAKQLLIKEVIFKEDLEKIFGERTFKISPQATSNGQKAEVPSPAPVEPSTEEQA